MALRRGRRLAMAGTASASPETRMHFVARLRHASRAAGIVSVSRNGQRQALMVERDLAVFSRGPRMVVLLLRPITAAATIRLVRSVRTHPRPVRPRVRQDTAAAITMAVVQAMPHQVSAEWVRLTARHRCHITTHQRHLTIVRLPLPITVRQPHLTIALREEGAEVVDLVAAVRPEVVGHLTAGILLRVAVAATEDHDSSLKPLQFADRTGAAFFFALVRTRVGPVSSDFLAVQ
jgi:hypothetical protein